MVFCIVEIPLCFGLERPYIYCTHFSNCFSGNWCWRTHRHFLLKALAAPNPGVPSAHPVRQPNPHIKQAFRGTFRNRIDKLNRFSYLFNNRLPVKSCLRKAFQIAGGTEIELAPVHVQRFAEPRANQDVRSGVV
jgi:hypothetical protein